MKEDLDMVKENYVWEVSDLARGFGRQEDLITLVGSVLAVAKGDKGVLTTIAQSQNVLEDFLDAINKLEIEDVYKQHLMGDFKQKISKSHTSIFVKILIVTEKYLKDFSTEELYEMVISILDVNGRDIFATPNSISEIAINYLMDGVNPEHTFHDGTVGYGVSAVKYAEKNEQSQLFLQDLNKNAILSLRLRLFMKDLSANLAIGDIIQHPAFVENEQLMQFDRVYMAPPFGLKLGGDLQEDMTQDRYNRFVYGVPPRSQGDLAFVSCGLSATKLDGKAAFLLPAGVLFRGGPEKVIRQNLIDFDVIEAVVALPSSLHSYTSINTVLVLCNKNKVESRKGKVLMIDAEDFGVNNRKETVLGEQDIQKISEIILLGQEIDEVSRFVASEEIKLAQLTPNKYIVKKVAHSSEFGNLIFNMDELENIEMKPLSQFVEFYRGFNVPTKDENADGELGVLKISDIQNGEIQYNSITRYSITNNAKVDNYRIQKGDVLLSIRGVNRKVAVFNRDTKDTLMSQNFSGMRCNESLNPRFLQLYLESPVAQYYLDSYTTGTTIMNVSLKDLKNLPIPVMSLEEQEKIITVFDEEQKKLTEELKRIEARQKELKLEAYAAIGIDKAFTIQ